MPSKFPWSKSNRSHASVGSAPDPSSHSHSHSSDLLEGSSSAQQYSVSEGQQQYYAQTGIAQRPAAHRLSSHPQLERPPIHSTHSHDPAQAGDGATADSAFTYSVETAEGSSQQNEHRKSGLRSKLGFRHHPARDSEIKAQPAISPANPSAVGLGRTLSLRRKEPGSHKDQTSPVESQRRGHLWSSRHSSSIQLPPSEEEEEPGLDPFLVQTDHPGPLVPPKDYQPSPTSSLEQYPGRPLARVNSGHEHYSTSEPQAPYHQQSQYQPYQQPPSQSNPQAPYHSYQQSASTQSQSSSAPTAQQATNPAERRSYPQPGESPIHRRPPPSQQSGISELQQPQTQQHQGYQVQQQQQAQGQPSNQAQPAREINPEGSGQSNIRPPSPLVLSRNQQDRPNSAETDQRIMPSGSSRESTGYGQGSHGNLGLMQPPTPGVSGFSVSPASVGQHYKSSTSQLQPQPHENDGGRNTPNQITSVSDMSEDEVNQIVREYNQLIKDHKELRDKYNKVKKYYFEKDSQVQQLQNTLANQRLSLSKTSLDDSEYATRFNRLDGLIAQLAFGIRKNWKSIPPWMQSAVNKDAVTTGKQEMTVVGRAFISSWLVDEVFEKYFHPDLELGLSSQLKMVQSNLRRFAPTSHSSEEEESLMAKIVNWRLCTLEGIQDMLRSSQSTANRQQLIERLNEKLIASLQMYLQEPSPPELEGGVHMIIDLVVNNIAIHLPLESRDVHIQYFPPGHAILLEFMKLETGIPALTNPCAEETDRASLRSTASDLKDSADARDSDTSISKAEQEPKRKGVLGGLMGVRKPGVVSAQQGKQAGAGGSQSSLTQQPPGSSSGPKEEAPQRVRLAAFAAVQVRGRSVLLKAPVFST